jgi:hypothetical protein
MAKVGTGISKLWRGKITCAIGVRRIAVIYRRSSAYRQDVLSGGVLYVLYSSDYELFLGGNRLPEAEVLIRPTERLLGAAEELGVPITLFADLASAWRYRELGQQSFPDAMDAQLRDAIRRRHDVQTHLHPHWLTTDIERTGDGSTRYRADPSRYLLGNWAPPEGLRGFVRGLLRRAREHLVGLCAPLDASYRCVAFRAGGYGLQPHAEEILGALLEEGYEIDSSVVPGMVLESNVNRIDFRQVPRRANYRLSPEGALKSPSARGVYEIPIPTAEANPARRATAASLVRTAARRLVTRRQSPEPARGYPIQSTEQGRPATRLEVLRRKLDQVVQGFSMLELSNDPALMLEVTHRWIEHHQRPGEDLYFSFSSHSKTITDLNLRSLARYHQGLVRRYGGQLRAIRFQDAATQVEGR